MSPRPSWTAGALALAVLTVGCGKSEEEEFAPAFVPRVVAFEGQVDKRYVGSWESEDKASRYEMAGNGDLKLATTTNSVQGKSTSKTEGKWLASDGRLRFQYGKGTDLTTLEFEAKFEKGGLVLQQPGGSIKTTFKKQ